MRGEGRADLMPRRGATAERTPVRKRQGVGPPRARLVRRPRGERRNHGRSPQQLSHHRRQASPGRRWRSQRRAREHRRGVLRDQHHAEGSGVDTVQFGGSEKSAAATALVEGAAGRSETRRTFHGPRFSPAPKQSLRRTYEVRQTRAAAPASRAFRRRMAFVCNWEIRDSVTPSTSPISRSVSSS